MQRKQDHDEREQHRENAEITSTKCLLRALNAGTARQRARAHRKEAIGMPNRQIGTMMWPLKLLRRSSRARTVSRQHVAAHDERKTERVAMTWRGRRDR